MSQSPQLPALYELVSVDCVHSAVTEARRLALDGADEGTIVLARDQSAALGRSGQAWFSAADNLHCALILRPDYSTSTALELSYVAAISLGAALAHLVAPMVGLHYRWPNDVLVNSAKAATIVLEAPKSRAATPEWLLLGLSVNVKSCPEDTAFPATSLLEVEGEIEFDRIDVLEGFSRHFLSWINRWAEDGLPPVLETWRARAVGVGDEAAIDIDGETLRGKLSGIDDQGSAILEREDGSTRIVTMAEFYSIER